MQPRVTKTQILPPTDDNLFFYHDLRQKQHKGILITNFQNFLPDLIMPTFVRYHRPLKWITDCVYKCHFAAISCNIWKLS